MISIINSEKIFVYQLFYKEIDFIDLWVPMKIFRCYIIVVNILLYKLENWILKKLYQWNYCLFIKMLAKAVNLKNKNLTPDLVSFTNKLKASKQCSFCLSLLEQIFVSYSVVSNWIYNCLKILKINLSIYIATIIFDLQYCFGKSCGTGCLLDFLRGFELDLAPK